MINNESVITDYHQPQIENVTKMYESIKWKISTRKEELRKNIEFAQEEKFVMLCTVLKSRVIWKFAHMIKVDSNIKAPNIWSVVTSMKMSMKVEKLESKRQLNWTYKTQFLIL